MLRQHSSQRGYSRRRANESRFLTRSDSRSRRSCYPSSYFRPISPQSSGAEAAGRRKDGATRCRCCMRFSFCLQSGSFFTLIAELSTLTSPEQREQSSFTTTTLPFVNTGRRSRSKTIHTRTNYWRLSSRTRVLRKKQMRNLVWRNRAVKNKPRSTRKNAGQKFHLNILIRVCLRKSA